MEIKNHNYLKIYNKIKQIYYLYLNSSKTTQKELVNAKNSKIGQGCKFNDLHIYYFVFIFLIQAFWVRSNTFSYVNL